MSGFYKINSLKKCLSSLKTLKNVNKINNKLGKDIQELCSKSNDVTGITNRIKEVNEVLRKVSLNVRNNYGETLNKLNENNVSLNRLEDSCKLLFSISNRAEERKNEIGYKVVKSRNIKYEAEKLYRHVSGKVLGNTLGWSSVAVAASQGNATADAITKSASEVIPEPPPVPDITAETVSSLNALGEPTFASMGLGGWTPVGIVQNCLEYLHVSLGLEWWAVIALGTLVIRLALFPLVVVSQRNAAKMNNYLPQIQMLQLKMTEARQSGDSLNAARYGQEMMLFMSEKGLNPLKNMIVPLAQAPIFLSFFMGLKEMANTPVASMAHGGMFWFTDLTVPDQFFILPIITSATLFLSVELGADMGKMTSENMVIMKYALRAIPLIILPFSVNFPGAILCYWVSTNLISLVQVGILRIPKVRAYFNIEQLVTHQPDQLPVKPKTFKQGLKDAWTNVKITKELEERRRLDEMQFQKAGKGPIQKTYKFDPTKHVTPSAISAKKR